MLPTRFLSLSKFFSHTVQMISGKHIQDIELVNIHASKNDGIPPPTPSLAHTFIFLLKFKSQYLHLCIG